MLDRRKLLALVRAVVDAFRENRLLTYASAMAFRSLVALIPLTLLAIALLGAFGQQRVWERTLAPPIAQRTLLPVFAGVDATVEEIFTTGGWVLIAFATLLALLDVSSAVRACMSGLNEILGTRDRRPTWLRFAVSFALAVAVIVCLVGAVLLVTAGSRLAGSSGGLVHVVVGVLRWLTALVLLGFTVALVVRYGPYRHPSKAWVSAGSATIVLAWVAASLVFKWFVGSILSYRSGPGILAAFLVLTTYFYVSSIIFMVGAQLDALLQDGG